MDALKNITHFTLNSSVGSEMRNPPRNHLFRQQAKLCSKPHQQVVPPPPPGSHDPSPVTITEVLMGCNKVVWLLLLI